MRATREGTITIASPLVTQKRTISQNTPRHRGLSGLGLGRRNHWAAVKELSSSHLVMRIQEILRFSFQCSFVWKNRFLDSHADHGQRAWVACG